MEESTEPKQRAEPTRESDRARFLPSFNLSVRTHITALIALITTLCIFRISVLIRFSTHVLGGAQGDAGLYGWLMQVVPMDLATLPWFFTRAFYPYGTSLAWSDNFILPSLLAQPLLQCGLSYQSVFNLLILFANLLNGYLTFRLFFQITGDALNSFSVGAAFMTASAFSLHLGHPQLQFFFFIPATLILFFHFLRNPRPLPAVGIGLTLFCCFLTTVYYFVFSALTLFLATLVVLLLRPAWLTAKRIAVLLLGTTIGLLPVIPFVLPYLAVKETFGPRHLYEAYYFAASSLSYLSSASQNLLYGALSKLSHSEAHLFPGLVLALFAVIAISRLGESKTLQMHLRQFLVVMVLLLILSPVLSGTTGRVLLTALVWGAIGLFIRLTVVMGRLERKLHFTVFTGRDLIALFAVVGLVFFALSLGPLGNPEKHQLAIAPYRLAYEMFPGFAAIRASSRCGLMVIFSLCILYGLALSKVGLKKNLGAGIFLPTIFLLIENYHNSIPVEAPRPAPPALAELANRSGPLDGIIVLPFAGLLDENNEVKHWSQFATLNVTAMRWLVPFKGFSVNGYSGQRSKLMKELPRELRGFPDTRSLNALSQIVGLRYIFYDSNSDPEFDTFTFNEKMSKLPAGLSLVSSDDYGGYLFELNLEIAVGEGLEFVLPPWRSSTLSLEISVPADAAPKGLLELFIKDKDDLPLLASIPFTSGQDWQTHNIALPNPSDSVRPMQLLIYARSSPNVRLRRVHLENAGIKERH